MIQVTYNINKLYRYDISCDKLLVNYSKKKNNFNSMIVGVVYYVH